MRISPVSFTRKTQNVQNNNKNKNNNVSFGRFADQRAERKARQLLTAPRDMSYMQPCYTGAFNTLRDCDYVTFSLNSRNKLEYELGDKITESERISSFFEDWYEPKNAYSLHMMAETIRMADDAMAGIPLLTEDQSGAAEYEQILASQREMRWDALAK